MIFGYYTPTSEFLAYGGENPFSCLSFIQVIFMLVYRAFIVKWGKWYFLGNGFLGNPL